MKLKNILKLIRIADKEHREKKRLVEMYGELNIIEFEIFLLKQRKEQILTEFDSINIFDKNLNVKREVLEAYGL